MSTKEKTIKTSWKTKPIAFECPEYFFFNHWGSTHCLRWLKTAVKFQCQYVKEDNEQNYVWRRLQISQQQAERQRKNIIQLSMLFHSRAEKVQKEKMVRCGLFSCAFLLYPLILPKVFNGFATKKPCPCCICHPYSG